MSLGFEVTDEGEASVIIRGPLQTGDRFQDDSRAGRASIGAFGGTRKGVGSEWPRAHKAGLQFRGADVIVVAIQHPVTDYEAWKKVYDEENPVALGHAVFARVNRSVDDPNTIAVVAGFESLDKAQAFLNSPDLKEAMQRAGVSGETRIEIYEEVEALTA